MDFEKKIAPFFWVEHDASCSVCLTAGEYLQEVFETRAEEGFEGGGYDWESLARVFLARQLPRLEAEIGFDSEGSMFCAYSKNREALEEFILSFKAACEDRPLILELFRQAGLD